jgi:hypothetical protein
LRIHFVAIADSIHTAHWIGQFTRPGWDIHILDLRNAGLMRQLTTAATETAYRPFKTCHNFRKAHHERLQEHAVMPPVVNLAPTRIRNFVRQ